MAEDWHRRSMRRNSTLSRLGGRYLTPFRIAVAYAGFGMGLLVISDVVFPEMIADPGLLRRVQAAKGAVEVLTSAVIIYALVASAQRELRVKERALDEAPVGISITDPARPDNPLVYVNEGFERVTGYPAAECLGRNCRFLQGENTGPETTATVRAAIDDERPVSVEILNYRKDGIPFWNRLDIVPVEDGGRVTHFLGIQQDVTERKEREQRLSVLNRVFRHDLRNKLNVVMGRVDHIEANPDQVTKHVEPIRRAAGELLHTADQLRRFDELADTEGLGEFDLTTVATEAAATARDHGDVTVDCQLSGTATVLAHPTIETALPEVFRLLGGADGGGCTAVLLTESDRVTLELHDEGGVLSDRDLAVVGGDLETPLEHLQGLELWLVRWAVERSRGEFTVDSEGGTPVVRLRFLRLDDAGPGSHTGT